MVDFKKLLEESKKEELSPEEMKELGVLPIMFIGNYEVEKFPCQAHDDSTSYSLKREDMCSRMGYSVHQVDTPFGKVRVALCKKHWAKAMRLIYSNKQSGDSVV